MGSGCPMCQKDDMVVKVTSVFSTGVTATTQSGPAIGVGLYGGKIGVGLGGSSSSGINVSQLSMRIKPPSEPKGISCLSIVGYFVISLVLSMIAEGISSGFSYVVGILCLVGGIILLIKARQRKAEKMSIYNRLMSEWNSSYYCSRDDLVFVPGKQGSRSPESMQSYFEASLQV